MIASGPAYPDSSTCEDAMRIAEKYGLRLSDPARALLQKETPKTLTNVETQITGLCPGALRGGQKKRQPSWGIPASC